MYYTLYAIYNSLHWCGAELSISDRLVVNYVTLVIGQCLLLVLTICSVAAVFPRVSTHYTPHHHVIPTHVNASVCVCAIIFVFMRGGTVHVFVLILNATGVTVGCM